MVNKTTTSLKNLLIAGALALLAACASHPVGDLTIAQALAAPDDTKVVVTGEIVQKVDREHLLLRDGTGQINVQADDDILGKMNFAPDARVRIMGKIDRDKERSLLIAKTVQVVQ